MRFIEIAAALCLTFVDGSINLIVFQQFLVRTEAVYAAVIQYDNTVCILDTGNTLCDNKLGCVWNLLTERFTDTCICCSIHCTGGVIQNQNLWLFE